MEKDLFIDYKEYHGALSDEILRGVTMVYQDVFETMDIQPFYSKYQNQSRLYTQVAQLNSEIIAFKMGYALDDDVFYSWLGGVKMAYRGHGIASALMRLQHEGCTKMGFNIIQTKTMNRWRNMLLLNIKNGFDVVSTYRDKNGEVKIVLELPLKN